MLPFSKERGEKMLKEVRAKRGSIKYWYNGENGYGFIRPDDEGEAVFVHHTCIAAHAKAKSLNKGVRVIYEESQRKMGGLWAKNVCRID